MNANICVYCGAGDPVDTDILAAARMTGGLIAAGGHTLVYGGGKLGLMGAVANAALEAGGKVTGIIPDHLRQREVQHDGISELIVVDSMHIRKQAMEARSDAFIILPGGWGTLDEAFEILTWKQLGLHAKPVVFVNVKGFWDPLLRLFAHQIEAGFLKPAAAKMYTVAAHPLSAIDCIEEALFRATDLSAAIQDSGDGPTTITISPLGDGIAA